MTYISNKLVYIYIYISSTISKITLDKRAKISIFPKLKIYVPKTLRKKWRETQKRMTEHRFSLTRD